MKIGFAKQFASNLNKKFSTIKHFKALTVTEGKKTISKGPIATYEIEAPLEALLACAGSCEIHIIHMVAKQNRVPIEKIEVDVKGEYDVDRFRGNAPGNNTYSHIDIDTKVYSSETDKKKLEETVEAGIFKCPVLNTLKLAGIKLNKKVTYL